jgi:DNA helicase-2/ATP-dependent DNA helicase PcrA
MKLILGGPGAGKTATLLSEVERILARGVRPDRLAFVAFTNAAADEARSRACERFGFATDDLPWFRTIHSLAFRQLGLSRNEVMGNKDYTEFAKIMQESFSGNVEGPAAIGNTGSVGGRMLAVEEYARTTLQDLPSAWHEQGGEIDWFRMERFAAALDTFKRDSMKLDFTDMLLLYPQECAPLDVDAAIVDEAQDLTPAQWRVIWHAFANVQELIIAGDDDQAIYRWSGADVEQFLSLEGERHVLPQSYRLPRTVFELSQQVVKRINRRYSKRMAHAPNEGAVNFLQSEHEVDLTSGTWLLLARNGHMLDQLAQVAYDQGVVYSVRGEPSVRKKDVRAIRAWETLRNGRAVYGEDAKNALTALGWQELPRLEGDFKYTATDLRLGDELQTPWFDALSGISYERREYYQVCRRRGEDLEAEPRVRVKTIHGAKGAEAENTLIKTDMSYRTYRGYCLDPDGEHRVFYVALTRASQNLNIMMPQSPHAYEI